MASRRSGRVVAQRSGLKGHVDYQVVVLRLLEEDRVRRARHPAAASARSSVSMSCSVMMSKALMNLPFNCGETPGSLPSVVGSETGSSDSHVRGHLVEEARRIEDGRLHLYKYTTATEHMLIQREREGPQHEQKVGEV